MCCRYLLLREHARKLLEQLGVVDFAELTARYNIAPGTEISAVRVNPRKKARELARLRWGLVPSWAKTDEGGAALVNARAESVAEKPSFRDAYRQRRCLIPASGFYEWQQSGRARLPWLFQLRDEQPFFLAGLWESWVRPDGMSLETCTVVTTEPNEVMAPIHHRMPAIITGSSSGSWLEANASSSALAKLLQPFPAEQLTARPVSARVSNVHNDDAECLAVAEPVKDAQLGLEFG